MKKALLGLLIVLLLVPSISNAQVTDPVQRAAIIQLIEVILERIKEIQADLATSQISKEDRKVLEQIKQERKQEDLKNQEIKALQAKKQPIIDELKRIEETMVIFGCQKYGACENNILRYNQLREQLRAIDEKETDWYWCTVENNGYWKCMKA